MKTLIIALNSKYIHSALAPWCLFSACKAYCKTEQEISVFEGTVNENEERLFERILAFNADTLAFSCYIWNVERVLSLCGKIKKAKPDTVIILGGPEVAYRQGEILENYTFIDFVLSGEGELVLPKLLDSLCKNENYEAQEGVSFMKNGSLVLKKEVIGESFDYPSPYCEEYFSCLGGRLAYFESSRGCPFSCAYCLSGRCGKVKFKSLEKTKEEILLLASSSDIKTVKFVDRTFNCNNERAVEILRFIREQRGIGIPQELCFHFEISADILKDSFINEVALSEKGQLQFEIGIQSLNEKTLSAIGRKSEISRLFENIRRLVELRNCHIHTDLIAGLPHESFESFVSAFNKCYFLKADMLQLGFLKLLHGSPLREKREDFPCIFSQNPPYEIISTPSMSEDDLYKLHKAEKELDRLYNSARFSRTLDYVLKAASLSPFELFYFAGEKLGEESLPLDRYTDRVFEHFSLLEGVEKSILRDKMLFDRIATNNSGVIPKSLVVKDERLKKVKHQLSLLYPFEKGVNRCVALLYGEKKVIFCDYLSRNPITGEYDVRELDMSCFDKEQDN